MLHDYLERRGARGVCEISLVLPLPAPVPPSPETSKALIAAFAERNIKFYPSKRVIAVNATRRIAVRDDNSEMAFDLFLGVVGQTTFEYHVWHTVFGHRLQWNKRRDT